MERDDEEDWFGKTLRLRNLGLYLPSKACTVTRSGTNTERKKYSLNNEIFYPTILCELCEREEICDLFHLHVCPKMKELNAEREEKYNNVCKEMTGETMEPYYWCERTEKATITTSTVGRRWAPKYCICKTEKHGEYLCCHQCIEVFHPTCIGISKTKEEIEARSEPFLCQKCNPKAEYFYENSKWEVTKGTKKKGRKEKKAKISTEVLITHALKITSVLNRRKRIWAEYDKERLRAIELRHKKRDENADIARYKRATLGYMPKEFVIRFRELARKNEQKEEAIEEAIERINLDTIQHSYTLYGAWLKANRKMRKEEGTDLRKTYAHNRFTKERNQSEKKWARDTG
jgi:hypothetical protein